MHIYVFLHLTRAKERHRPIGGTNLVEFHSVNSGPKLSGQLSKWLKEAADSGAVSGKNSVRAIIGPYAKHEKPL